MAMGRDAHGVWRFSACRACVRQTQWNPKVHIMVSMRKKLSWLGALFSIDVQRGSNLDTTRMRARWWFQANLSPSDGTRP